MVAATAARGLSKAELESIRSTLASGRKPKVVFTEAAGQIAGQTGQVVELLDPSRDEWIVVRFGRDELPFSPIDLAIAPKTPVKRAPMPASPMPARPAAGPATPGTDATSSLSSYETIATVPPPRQEVPMPVTDTSIVDTTAAAPEAKPARKAAKAAKPKPTPSLVVTIAYADGEWTVGAQQGAKALAKPYLIKAAEALQLVGMLDVPGVHEAVEQIVEAERTETQAHAARLRAELAEIEARLADLPSTR